MRGYMAALALTLPCALGAGAAAAQSDAGAEQAAQEPLTAETIIEVARERLRPPGLPRPCKPADTPNEIVVCAENPEKMRVESPTDEAIRKGEPVDEVPRAPDVFGIPPCKSYTVCTKIGRTPEPPLIVDLTHIPEGLSAEEAAHVYRVEDGPPRATPPVPDGEAAPAP